MATTIDRQRRHDEKWQSEVLDGMNRMLAVLHDVSDGVRDLAETVRRLERATQPPPPPTPAGQAEFLSVGDLAELIGLSEGAVRNLRYRGRGPAATKVGGRLRFRRRDVEEWLAGERKAEEAPTRPWKESWLGGGIGSGLARTTEPSPYCPGSHTEPAEASRFQSMGICRMCRDDVSVIKNGTLRKHRPRYRW